MPTTTVPVSSWFGTGPGRAQNSKVPSARYNLSARMGENARRASVTTAADLTKLVVCVAVAATALVRQDCGVILYIGGALLNAGSAKLLKRIINQSRPDGATKVDPGMPSSHATSLSFLSILCAAAIVDVQTTLFAPAVRLAAAASAVTAAVVACSWRVYCGYHTVPQILVGWALGTLNSAIWTWVLGPSLQGGLQHLIDRFGSFSVTVMAVCLVSI